jgi:hypothetical protein
MSIALVRDLFSRVSGLSAHHAGLRYTGDTNQQKLDFDGVDKSGKPFHIESPPFNGDPNLAAETLAKQTIEFGYWRPNVSKASSLAARIADTKKRFEAEQDKIAARLDAFDHKSPDVIARASSIVEGQHSEIDTLDAELRQLSNLNEH